jgi:CubicO group peptidase (beta-lactamase class C family)
MKHLTESELVSITKSPGGQYIAADANNVLNECYAGFADITTEAPVSVITTFNAFSITKTATAAAVLRLVEQDKIVLSDAVNPMFDEFDFKYPFTVQQLISHPAGFTDPVPISWIHLTEEELLFDVNAFTTELIKKHPGQKFRPGTKFSYSSIGYLLLGKIIEKISGKSYKDYVRKNVIRSPGNDGKLDFIIGDSTNHATGYHQRYSISNLLLGFFLNRKKYIKGNYGKWMAFNNFYVNGKPYGGLIGNVRGLVAYLQLYLADNMFAHIETQQLMFTEQKAGMALSWFTGLLHGKKYVCHAGDGGGYYCEIRIYPELKLATALLRNKSSFHDLRLLDKIDSKIIF